MPYNYFWLKDNQANLKKMIKLIKDNPTITVSELSVFFKKSRISIEKTKQRYGIKTYGQVQRYIPTIDNKPVVNNLDKLEEIKPVNWKIAKTKLTKVEKKPFKTYLVIADAHIPYQNVAAVKSILKLMDDIRFDGLINLGDFLDLEPISRHLLNKNKNKTLENKRLRIDYIEGNRLLDEFDKRMPKKCDKRFFIGNHEDWGEQFIEQFPMLEGLVCPTTALKLKERGYIVYPVNHIERMGRISLCHGMYCGMNFVKKHIDSFKTNVMFGHLHSTRMRLDKSPAKEIAIAGYGLGCLCNLNPEYLKNKPNQWSHGFAILYLCEDGFFVDLKRIVKGRFIFNNKLYDGNK